jgi:hypothetical protein
MKNKLLQELGLAVLLIGLALIVLKSGHFGMPTMVWQAAIIALLVIFALFAVFVWRESARDEREIFLRMRAGRIGFLVGAGFLLLGIVVQSLSGGQVDGWLLGALVTMILAKWLAAACADRWS